MEKLSAYLRAILILLLSLLLCACAQTPSPPDYRASGFSAELVWQEETLTLCAKLTVGKPQSEQTALRDLTLTFLSPSSMAGITLCRENGVMTVDLGDLKTNGEACAAWLNAAELLLCDGQRKVVDTVEENGQVLLYSEVHSENGEKVYECYLDPTTGAPKRITLGTHTVEIRSFTPIP